MPQVTGRSSRGEKGSSGAAPLPKNDVENFERGGSAGIRSGGPRRIGRMNLKHQWIYSAMRRILCTASVTACGPNPASPAPLGPLCLEHEGVR
jgi:hypothetical protein